MNKSQANIMEDSEYSIILVINNSYTIIKITLDFGLSVLRQSGPRQFATTFTDETILEFKGNLFFSIINS